jgi:hypothetical protein
MRYSKPGKIEVTLIGQYSFPFRKKSYFLFKKQGENQFSFIDKVVFDI